MKKLLYSAAALALAFFAGSCQQENLEPISGSNIVSYTVQVPGTHATKAAFDTDIQAVNKVYYEVYREAEVDVMSAGPVYDGFAEVRNGSAEITLEFVKDQKFVVLFWAQNADLSMFNIDDLRAVRLVNPGTCNNQNAQVFAGSDTVTDCVSAVNGNVSLTRPVSQLNIATDQASFAFGGKTIQVSESAVKVKGLSSVYNVATKEADTAGDAHYETYEAPVYSSFDVNGKTYYYIAMNYVAFADKDGSVAEVEYTITTSEGEIFNEVSNVPFKQNYRTNIIGNLLTGETKYEITLDNEWDGDISVWDGTTVTEPVYNAQAEAYEINKASDLAWFAAVANGTHSSTKAVALDNFEGKTFTLKSDIDLGGHEWTPISISDDLSGGKTFRGTFDGAGHTIYGLTVNNSEVAGLFGYVYAATIKNVTIENATLNTNHFAGGIVGWVLNSKGNIQVPFVLENCHVKNSVITSAAEQVNGKWDNGDKVGGLIGYACFGDPNEEINAGAKISNCSVDNVSIKAYRDFAGLIGYASHVVIENCSAENITLEQDLTHDYKAPETPSTFGIVIGRDNGGNTVDGKAYVTDGVLEDSDANYHILNAAGLKWVATEVNKVAAQAANIFDNKVVYLENDIDLNGAEWTPIGDYAFNRTVFRGTFDGQNHTVKNFKITEPTKRTDKVTDCSYGLFGNMSGTVKNLTVENAILAFESSNQRYMGALVGRMKLNSVIDNCHVKNSSVSMAYWQAGGLVGQIDTHHSISNCTVTGTTVAGKAAIGAIAGLIMNAGEQIIENCLVSDCAIVQNGQFSDESYSQMFAGVVGSINNSASEVSINNCKVVNTTVKGEPSEALYGYAANGAKVTVDGAGLIFNADEFIAAIQNGGKYALANNISLKETTYSNVNFELDGCGYTISQEGTNNYALLDSVTGKISLKNVVFAGIRGGAVIRTIGAEANFENVTVEGAQTTQQQGLFRLIGQNTIKNCTFKNNSCCMLISINYDGMSETHQLVENCVFEGNTCDGTAVLYYVKGAGVTVNGNKFVGNTVNCNGNGATIYTGFQENVSVTNNLFQNNTVNEAGESSRVAGAIFFGYDSQFTGNAFIGNNVTGTNAVAKDVCVSTYYTSIDLSGNYWGGSAPVEGENYYVQHKSAERPVIVNRYMKNNPFANN